MIDPRLRLAGLVVLAFLIVMLEHWLSLSVAAGTALAAMFLFRRVNRSTLKRQAGVNVFFFFLVVVVPGSVPGRPLFSVGNLNWTLEGALYATSIGLRANVVMLLANALISDIEPSAMAHSLQRMGVPTKLAYILFFCIRYLEVLHREYHRLRNALRTRAFRAGPNLHCLKALGYLAAMLFARSLDRSERIVAAMKCRGFDGRLYSLSEFKVRPRDALFGCCIAVFGFALITIELGI